MPEERRLVDELQETIAWHMNISKSSHGKAAALPCQCTRGAVLAFPRLVARTQRCVDVIQFYIENALFAILKACKRVKRVQR